MGDRSGQPGGANFLKNLIKCAILLRENDKADLFIDFVSSIPIEDDSDENCKNRKRKKKNAEEVSMNNKRRKGNTSSSRKCKKTSKTKNVLKKHQDACKTDKLTHKGKSVGSGHTTQVSHKKQNDKCKKSNTKTKNDENNANSHLKQCMFCTDRRVRINHHYLTKHKLDYHKFMKKLSEKDSQRNSTTCPQCNEDLNNKTDYVEHLVNYHMINLEPETLREQEKKKSQEKEVNEDVSAPKEAKSVGNKVQEERENIESNPDAQKKMETGPSAEERETQRNQNAQDHRERVGVPGVQRRCNSCLKFIDVSSFETHVASHEREREKNPFKTTRDSIRSAANRSTRRLSNSNETVENIVSGIQDGRVASLNGAMDQREPRGNINTLRNATGSENAKETYNRQGDANVSQDIGEENVSQVAESSEEVRMQADVAKMDEERHTREVLWHDFFDRMKNENVENQTELFTQYLQKYALIAPKSAICHKRLTRRQNDDAGRQRRIDIVSMTQETFTCSSGVSFTRKLTYLKTIRYE